MKEDEEYARKLQERENKSIEIRDDNRDNQIEPLGDKIRQLTVDAKKSFMNLGRFLACLILVDKISANFSKKPAVSSPQYTHLPRDHFESQFLGSEPEGLELRSYNYR